MKNTAAIHCLHALLAYAALAGPAAQAAVLDIPVQNPGFDSSVPLSPGAWTAVGTGIRQAQPVPGWVVTGWDAGLHRPRDDFFDTVYADGTYAYFGGTGGGDQRMEQSLGLVAAGHYRVAVDVGWRTDLAFGGYRIDLLAAGVVVASNLNGEPFDADDRGSFKRVNLDWVVADTSLQQGQTLGLRLSAPGNAAGTQTGFDNVTVQFTPAAVPEPGTVAMALCGLALIGGRLQRQLARRA